ncbi:MAG TPA: hypothetical protein VFH69_09235 [Gemmatimonadota bacterium]|nr:hypothetical protein [Gemmatimonadota bacterium]
MKWMGFEGIGGRRLARGIGRWVAFHSEWKQDVACGVIDRGGPMILVDPLLPRDTKGQVALDGLATRAAEDGPPAIVLTVFYHERSAPDIVERIPGTTLWTDRESSEKVEAEVTNPFLPGDPLPGGLVAYATARSDEVVVWDPESRSLFVGDVILGKGPIGIELCPESWLPDGVGLVELKASLQPLLDLPIARVLPGHGDPLLREARSRLERLLA